MSKNTLLSNLINYISSNSSGNVVIAAPSSGYALDVTGTGRFTGNLTVSSPELIISTASGNGARMKLISTSANGREYQIGSNYVTGNGEFAIYDATASASRLTITSAGNVGIGTSSPVVIGGYTALTLNNATTGGILTFQQNGVSKGSIYNDGSSNMYFGNNSGSTIFETSGSERMRIRSEGGIYINRASYLGAGYGLVIGSDNSLLQTMGMFVATNGNNNVNFFNASGTYVASISTNASTVSYGTGSDYRLKEDYKDFNGLEKVSAIKVYDFKFKSEGDRMEGVIAHELQEVIPYAVNGEKDEVNEDGSPKIQNVDYSKLVPILIKSIQELKEELDLLKQQ